MSTSDIAKTKTTYTYDTLGNLVYEKIKNKSVDYQYNELNQLVKRTDSQNQTYTYQYDKRATGSLKPARRSPEHLSMMRPTIW